MPRRTLTDHEGALVHKYYAPRIAGQLPAPLIDAAPTYCLKINYDWLRHVLGVLDALDQPDAWLGDEATVQFARSEVRRLIANIYECTELANMGCVIGQIIQHWRSDTPEGCLPLDGQFYYAGDYPELYDVLIDSWRQHNVPADTHYPGSPAGDWFYLPDFGGRTLVAAGTGDDNFSGAGDPWPNAYLTGTGAGVEDVTLTEGQLPPHNHILRISDHGTTPGGGHPPRANGGTIEDATTVIRNTGSGFAHENRMPFVVTNFCIVATCTTGESVMPFKLRQNPTNDCLLEQSLNNGVSWSTAYDFSKCRSTSDTLAILDAIERGNALLAELIDLYDGTPGSVDPILDYGDENDDLRDDALCYALDLWVGALQGSARDIKASGLQNASDTLAIVGTVLGGASSAIGALASIAGIAFFAPEIVAGLTLGAVGAGIGAIVTGLQADAINFDDPDAVEDVTCCMLGNLAGATLTETAFQNALTGCTFETENSQFLGDIVAGILADTGAYLTFIKLLASIIPAAIDGVQLPCPCGEEFCDAWDFESLTEFPDPPLELGTTSQFIAETGVRNNGDGNASVIWNSPIGAVTVTSVQFERLSSGNPGQDAAIQYEISGGGFVTLFTAPGGSSGRQTHPWTGNVAADRIRVLNEGSTSTPGWIYNLEICYKV